MELLFDFKAFLKQVSTTSGVYKMLDKADKVLYVGKAVNLKNRLTSYYKKLAIDNKVTNLIQATYRIETFITQNSTEALLLEQNFIKSFKPKYNVLLKDDKSYPFLYLTAHSHYPALVFKRDNPNSSNATHKKTKASYFGPYPSSDLVKKNLSILQQIFLLRSCSDNIFNNRSRPCLMYQIKRCSAPCVNKISTDDYLEDVRNATLFLKGNHKILTSKIREQMQLASEALEFEKAAKFRDILRNISKFNTQQDVVNKNTYNLDVCSLTTSPSVCFYIMFVRGGKIVGDKYFTLSQSAYLLQADVLTHNLLAQFYLNSNLVFGVPQKIVLSEKVTEKTLLEETINNQHSSNLDIDIVESRHGQKYKWLQMAQNNLNNIVIKNTAALQANFIDLQNKLGIEKNINLIECFDVSHISGSNTVAACVAYDNNGKLASRWRKYNIKTATNNDYASMYETLMRHYSNILTEDLSMPELIVIDGGKGQLKMAWEAMKELNITNIYLLAISKGRKRIDGTETLYFIKDMLSATLSYTTLDMPNSKGGQLLITIRNKVHNFAITSHRKKRSKVTFTSQLHQLEGVGKKRCQLLLEHFGSIKSMQDASVNDFTKIAGISKIMAHKIHAQLANIHKL